MCRPRQAARVPPALGASRLVWLAEVPLLGLPHRQPILAGLLARQFDTLYVEPPPSGRAPRQEVVARDGLRVAQAAPLLNARPRLLRRLMASSAGRRLAAQLGTWQVQRLLKKTGWDRDPTNLAVVCSNVYLAPAVGALRPGRCVMDLCDDPRHYPGEPPWTHALMSCLALRADVATTSSRALFDELVSIGARQVVYLPNGISDSFLRAGRAPRTDGHAPRPRVAGFVGHFGTWLDFELIERLAASLAGRTLRLVGPVDPAALPQLRRVLGYAGVEYIPAVPYSDVPRVIATFDVGIIPFRTTPYTRAVNPVKLYEYAAFNLPIVSTAFSPDVAEFSPAVAVAEYADDFVRLVQERLDGQPVPDTRWIAESHTWQSVAHVLADLLEQRPSQARRDAVQVDAGGA